MPLTAGITLATSTVEKAIQSAIDNKHSVYISCLGGTGGEQPRRIDPKILRAVKNSQVIEAYCHLKKEMRTFSLHKIKRIKDHQWVPSGIIS
jgi:predicted DNA-binding transcriptional regulator YafY